jgi:hypothetical protein
LGRGEKMGIELQAIVDIGLADALHAKEIIKQLKIEFGDAQLHRIHSNDPSIMNGGYIGTVKRTLTLFQPIDSKSDANKIIEDIQGRYGFNIRERYFVEI